MIDSIKQQLKTITPRIDVETHCIFGFFMYICPNSSSHETFRLNFTAKDIPVKYHWVLQSIAAPKISDYAKDFWEPLHIFLHDGLITEFYDILLDIYFDKYGKNDSNSSVSPETSELE